MNGSVNRRDGAIVFKLRLDDPAPGIALFCITYVSQGLKVKGFFAAPEITPCPGLIYCRGGIRQVGMVRTERIVPLAQRGYAVFAPFYRGNEGGEGREDFGGEDRYDLYNAVKVMQSLPEVQPGSVPLMGFSRGAIMALLAAKECDGVGPVIVWGGVSDLLLTYEERVDLRRMLKRVVGHPEKQRQEYIRRSPIYWVGEIRSPVLIVHGSADDNVGVEHARRLAAALEAADKEYAMAIYEGRGHVFPEPYQQQALDFIFNWLNSKGSL